MKNIKYIFYFNGCERKVEVFEEDECLIERLLKNGYLNLVLCKKEIYINKDHVVSIEKTWEE